MNKIRVNKKDILNSYKNIIPIGYCDAYYLLSDQNKKYYTCGVYGWNADIYEIDNSTCIVTGYRPFGNIKNDYKILQKYEEQARKIMCDYSIDYGKKFKKVNKLLKKYIKEIMEV